MVKTSPMRSASPVGRRRGCATSPTSVFGPAHSATSSMDMAVPDVEVAVHLVAPDGELWDWGESTANSVSGSALDFCLVVTQRRHLADTALRVVGDSAAEWMAIAQAFAGGVGAGRAPGQFAVTDR